MRGLAWGRGAWTGPPGLGSRALSRAQRFAVLAAVFTLLALVVSSLVDGVLRPPLHRWAESKAINIGTKAVAAAVQDHLLPLIQEGSLFVPVTDADGQLVLIDYDMGRINRISAAAAHHIQAALARMTAERLPMPLGQLTGLDVLAGWGPPVPVRIVPIGSVIVEPRSDFGAAGINVIQHRLYVRVRVVMKVVAPYIDKEFPVEQDVLLSNQVIPGRVPQVYVGVEGVDLRQLPEGRLALLAAGAGGQPSPAAAGRSTPEPVY